ncbi:hypothetical protein CKAH01_12086 [Colletotrichum kahawae]|uniref:Uncharacterized protein n=1 Tax=Colletotrichum kahawae TaxID=34407 RepID=A0AAE0DCX1_COLKA|nr:hypothetical protein CKAH01_12086 [Colletotrichum kahawae]
MPGCQYCTEGVTSEGWICTRCKSQSTAAKTIAITSTVSPISWSVWNQVEDSVKTGTSCRRR